MNEESGKIEATGDFELWQVGESDPEVRLSDLLNRVLDRGVVLTGHVTISIADVDLVDVGLNAVLASASTLHRRERERQESREEG